MKPSVWANATLGEAGCRFAVALPPESQNGVEEGSSYVEMGPRFKGK